ncbi:MAG TPA: nucleotide sugar dehydrogenase [Rhizomicrobium sp.]|nr:nucleotide sugar dehydrogenase [Rhizomicrobium sp.]
MNKTSPHQSLMTLLKSGKAKVGIVGMGYVGLPLALAANRAGLDVIGFDIDPAKIVRLNDGLSTMKTTPDADIAAMRGTGRFRATGKMEELSIPDVVVICVPTPLNKSRDPDLSFVEGTVRSIAKVLRPGQMICLESTTYPGTTAEVVKPILEETGLLQEKDFFLAFSPERENPGSSDYHTATIPKVVGADDPLSREAAETFYAIFVKKVVPVSSAATAEAVKLTENIFRSVNIALANELKHIYATLGVDIWEVVDAAKTKPFGYMPFYPGPGMGGHCIPIDPFYLSWKARQHGVPTRFVELAGEINTAEPGRVIEALTEALSERKQKSLSGARILLLGIAYKKNVDDMRESPALTIFERLEARGSLVDYYDPWIQVIPETREHAKLAQRHSVAWDAAKFAKDYDAVLILTDHDGVDYDTLVRTHDLVMDTRNATRDVPGRKKVLQA